MKTNAEKLPSPWVSAIPLAVLTGLLYVVIRAFGGEAINGGSQIALLSATSVCVMLSIGIYRCRWAVLEEAIIDNIRASASAIVILLLINVLLLIVGTFMEALAAIVILTPILLPVVTGVGVSPLHFGVIIVINLAIGFVTPPVGVNLFVASGVAKAKLEKIAGMALPMIGLMLLVLLLCTYFPQVPLCLVGGK